jgi:hypothetical protein
MPLVAASGLLLVAAAGSALIGAGKNPPSATLQSPRVPTAAGPTTPAGESRPLTSAPLAAERGVSFTLDVSPGTAWVTLDGVPLPRLPFAGSFPIAGEAHVLEARAEGFQTERRRVKFDRDQNIEIALRAAIAPVRAHARRPLAATAADAAQTPLPASSARPLASSDNEEPTPGVELKLRPRQREFDTRDPYAE